MTDDYIRWMKIAAIAVLIYVLLDELAYYLWKRMNPGSQWSHLTEKTGLQNWNETNVGQGNLNYSRSGVFYTS